MLPIALASEPDGPSRRAMEFLHQNPIRAFGAEPDVQTAYRRAAAVLAAIRDVSALSPSTSVSDISAADRILEDDLVRAAGSLPLDGDWVMRNTVRAETLRAMSDQDIRDALQCNPQERTGRVQSIFEDLLMQREVAVHDLDERGLEGLLQAIVWLKDVRLAEDVAAAARQRLAWIRFASHFERMAGDAVFFGRVSEMDQLRSHVGVLPPARLLQKVKNLVGRARPALSLSGPGGIGKSALVARFALEHLRLDESVRIPVAYLDFDRADRDIGNLEALVREIADQMQMQQPGALRKFAEDRKSRKGQDGDARAVFAQLCRALATDDVPKPFVIIVDSFEEVQYRDEARAYPFWDLLDNALAKFPWIRVVVSGRAPTYTLKLGGQPPEQMLLGQFDLEATQAFMRSKGVEDSAAAEAIHRLVGGIPLSLMLAAKVLKAEGKRSLESFNGRNRFWRSPADDVIQAQLYDRFLGHIHDPRVRALAHPGLVLRRVDPDVILSVLNGPCKLELTNIDQARSLFNELARETSLVMSDGTDGSLVHRSDLRRVMLKLMVVREPGRVKTIHMAAHLWYSRQQSLRAEAEALYHALHLGHEPYREDFRKPDVRASIQASIADFDVGVQEKLLRFGFIVDQNVFKEASAEVRQTAQVAQLEERIPHGERAAAEAYESARVLEQSTDSPASVQLLLSRLAAQLGRVHDQMTWLEKAFESMRLVVNPVLNLEFFSDYACAIRPGGVLQKPAAEFTEVLEHLHALADRNQSAWAFAQVALHRLSIRSEDDTQNAVLAAQACSDVTRLEAVDLWAIFPLLPECLPFMRQFDEDVLYRLSTRLTDRESPFTTAAFPGGSGVERDTLAWLVSQCKRTRAVKIADRSYQWDHVLIEAFMSMARVWPYRVLRVQHVSTFASNVLRESI
ncbi:ATP-binding protein [Variovorax sp. OV700]|uniref:ATP-binding protein n=1 Tax=Variovorax sp. OV700 TaxID=1882826 RepID=UPI000884B418|nr:ATP-binding protein [Variovorax sp. OV700]SDI59423.1 AAA ATPase domain-containing protein [Variovorax sp. OV700]